MEEYIKQLLEDIRAAYQTEEPEIAITPRLPGETEDEYETRKLEEHFAEAERFVSEEPPHNLSYYCGLKPEQFPPVDQLNDEQVAAVIESFTAMLYSWNIIADIPEAVPKQRTYSLLISLLLEHFFMCKYGHTHWSFCECEPAKCVLGEYCSCREMDCYKELHEENKGTESTS